MIQFRVIAPGGRRYRLESHTLPRVGEVCLMPASIEPNHPIQWLVEAVIHYPEDALANPPMIQVPDVFLKPPYPGDEPISRNRLPPNASLQQGDPPPPSCCCNATGVTAQSCCEPCHLGNHDKCVGPLP